MLKLEEIRSFIDNDAGSTKKLLAKTGLRYFEGDHDIKDYRVFFFNAEGKLQEDETKSNIKIPHAFFRIIAEQEAQYILSGKDGFVKSDDPALQKELDFYFNENEDFSAELYELVLDTIIKGFGYMYSYKKDDNKTAFQCADSIGVVEVRAKETDDKCDHVIRWYVDSIGKDNRQIKRIQVWDDQQTYYYCQEDDGKIRLDDSVELNPRPHTTYKKQKDEKIYYKGFGFIPFFRLDNGAKQFSGLKPIKALIDSYDLMNCGLANNIQDTNEALYVVKGFQGDNLDELMVNIKAKKHIGVDEDGGVEIHTVDIPVEARKIKMEIDEKNIFRFGQGVNTESLKDTSATTSIAIKSAYANLDLKCDGLLPYLKQFMRKLLKVVLAEINEVNKSDYSQDDVYFTFDREIITNAQENAQIELYEAQKKQTEINTLLNLAPHIGNDVFMELVFEQLDLPYEDYKDRIPKPEVNDPYDAQDVLDDVQPDDEPADPDGGGVIE